MWVDYAEGGTGFAIVFDGKKLFTGANDGKLYALAPLVYDEGIQIDKTTKIIDRAIQLQRERELTRKELKRYWSEEVQYSLLACGLRFKASCWQHQREVRIVVAESDSLKPFVHARKTRVAVPFERPAIIRIVRGPTNAETDATKKISDVLNRAECGYIPIE